MDAVKISLCCSRDEFGYKQASKYYFALKEMSFLYNIEVLGFVKEESTKEEIMQMILDSDMVIIIRDRNGGLSRDLCGDLECINDLNRLCVVIDPSIHTPRSFFKIMECNIIWAIEKKETIENGF